MSTKAEDVINALYVPQLGDLVKFRIARTTYMGNIVATSGDVLRVKESKQGWFYETLTSVRDVTLVESR